MKINWKFWQRNTDSKPFDFDTTVRQVSFLTTKAQTTFCYRLIEVLPESVLRTMLRYIDARLKKITYGEAAARQRNTNSD